MIFVQVVGTTLLYWTATRASLTSFESLLSGKTFSLEEIPIDASPSSVLDIIQAPYLKFGLEPPVDIENSIARATVPDQSSVPTKSVDYDQEYVINVRVGNQTLLLDLDTGSSDLWVISSLLEPQRRNQPQSRIYDPTTSAAKRLEGHSWSMSYGDGSTAGGPVFTEQVTIGTLMVSNQAVEAARTISQKFRSDSSMDGLIGLGFSNRNNVRPNRQLTWFDNIRPKLAAPLFTSSLKRRAAGSYDFGYIDRSKFKGEIVWIDVKDGPRSKGYWDFEPSGFSVGDGETHSATFPAIVDTGSSQWYIPKTIAEAYWKSVNGSKYQTGYGWTFPCAEKLPDMSVTVSGKKVTVAGTNMNYKTIRAGLCWGGIQPDIAGMGFSIFGDVFLKGLFVVHEVPVGRKARIGFAQQA